MTNQTDGQGKAAERKNRKQTMSDGNFNRALLPSTPYASGVKMGKQQMRANAIAALAETLGNLMPELSEARRKEIEKDFSSRI